MLRLFFATDRCFYHRHKCDIYSSYASLALIVSSLPQYGGSTSFGSKNRFLQSLQTRGTGTAITRPTEKHCHYRSSHRRPFAFPAGSQRSSAPNNHHVSKLFMTRFSDVANMIMLLLKNCH